MHARTRCLRVLYTLREPVDRIWSHVRFHLKMQGKSHLLDGWNAEDIFTHIQEGDYLEHTDYVAAIKRMRLGMPVECLMVDIFERIGRDPQGFVADIDRFLEIEPRILPDEIVSRVINPSPPRPLPAGLAERLEPFISAQRDGLREMGFALPDSWG